MRSILLQKATNAIAALLLQFWVIKATPLFPAFVEMQALAILPTFIIFYPLSFETRFDRPRLILIGLVAALILGAEIHSIFTQHTDHFWSAMVFYLAMLSFYGLNILIDAKIFEGYIFTKKALVLSQLIRGLGLSSVIFSSQVENWNILAFAFTCFLASNLILLPGARISGEASSERDKESASFGQLSSGVLRIAAVNGDIYVLRALGAHPEYLLVWIGYAKLGSNFFASFFLPLLGRRRLEAHTRPVFLCLLILSIISASTALALGTMVPITSRVVALTAAVALGTVMVLLDATIRVNRGFQSPIPLIAAISIGAVLVLWIPSWAWAISILKFLALAIIFTIPVPSPVKAKS